MSSEVKEESVQSVDVRPEVDTEGRPNMAISQVYSHENGIEEQD